MLSPSRPASGQRDRQPDEEDVCQQQVDQIPVGCARRRRRPGAKGRKGQHDQLHHGVNGEPVDRAEKQGPSQQGREAKAGHGIGGRGTQGDDEVQGEPEDGGGRAGGKRLAAEQPAGDGLKDRGWDTAVGEREDSTEGRGLVS